MKAIAVFPKEKKVRLIDHPEPTIETPTQVKLKILDVGICGTDHEICQFKYGAPPEGSDYLILGHESLGEVIEIGDRVSNLKVGDLVVTMVRRPCSHKTCVACQQERQDFCYTGDFKERGINQLHGFMAEYVVDEEKYMLRVPAALRDIGVLTEPLTIAEKAMREVFHIQQRLPWGCGHAANNKPTYDFLHRALVIGAGPVGLLSTLVMCAQKFKTYVYSLEPETDIRAKIAMAMGATYLSAKNHTIQQIKDSIPGNLDVIFDGSGASKLAFQIINILGNNGVFVWTGIPGRREPVDINAGTFMQDIVLKNQNIVGSVNAGYEDFKSAIDDLAMLISSPLASSLMTRFQLDQFENVLLKPPAPGTFKSVLTFL